MYPNINFQPKIAVKPEPKRHRNVIPKELGETWASRNAFAFGRTQKGVQRTQVPAGCF